MNGLTELGAAVRRLSDAAWATIGCPITEAEAQQIQANLNRWYWSGPDRAERRVLRAYGIRETRFGLGKPSALRGYRRRRR